MSTQTAHAESSEPKAKADRTPKPAKPFQQNVTVQQYSEIKGYPVRSIHDLIDRGVLPFIQFTERGRIWLNVAESDKAIANYKQRRA
jgi:hypothetical protein